MKGKWIKVARNCWEFKIAGEFVLCIIRTPNCPEGVACFKHEWEKPFFTGKVKSLAELKERALILGEGRLRGLAIELHNKRIKQFKERKKSND